MKKKIQHVLRSERGDSSYISSFVYIFIVVIMIAFIINVFHIITVKQEMDHMADQLVKQIQLNGGTNSDTSSLFNYLAGEMNDVDGLTYQVSCPGSSDRMKMNNRFIYGILSIVLAAIITFIAIPAVTQKTSSTCEIVRIKNAVRRGDPITNEDIELVEIGAFNLPASVARKTEDVAGTYAAADLYPGDYILPEKVSSVPLSSDLILNEIPDGKVAISITTQTLATALSDKLQDGDIIRLYHYDDENLLEPVTDIPEFRFLKVLSVTDAKGLDIDYTGPPGDTS